MDLSPVSLVSPEPSAPAKPDTSALDGQQFDDLLAAGAAVPAPRPAAPPPVARVQDRSSQPSTNSRPAATAPTNATGSSDNSNATNATSSENSGSGSGSSQSTDQSATGDSGSSAQQTAQPAAPKAGKPADGTAPSGADGKTKDDTATALAVVATLTTAATPAATTPVPTAATGTPTKPETAPQPAGTPDLAAALGGATPTAKDGAPIGAPSPVDIAAPANAAGAAAQPSAAAATATAAAEFAALAAASSAAAAVASTATAKAATASTSAAPTGGPGKTAAEAMAQLNTANVVVKVANTASGQDAGQSSLGNLPGGDAGAETASAAATTTTSTLSGETLLASQLGEAAHHVTEAAAAGAPQDIAAPAPGSANALAANGATTTTATSTPTTADAPPPPRPVQTLQPLIDQVLPTLSEAANSQGGSRFTIQLRPPDLGKVQVDLKIDQDGHVTASVMADRQDTLSLLQRNSHQLEQALSDAGLTANNGDLQFSLSGDSQSTGFDESAGNSYNAGVAATAAAANEADAPIVTRQIGGLSLVDVHV